MIEAGLIEYWKKEWFPNMQCQRGSHAEAKAITLHDTVGLFLLLGLGLMTAFFVALLVCGREGISSSLIQS